MGDVGGVLANPKLKQNKIRSLLDGVVANLVLLKQKNTLVVVPKCIVKPRPKPSLILL